MVRKFKKRVKRKNKMEIGGEAAYFHFQRYYTLRLWLAHLTERSETRTKNSA